MLRLAVAACGSHSLRIESVVTGHVSPGAHGKCKRKHGEWKWMASENAHAARYHVLVCSRPCTHTHTQAVTRVHKIYGDGGWNASTFRMHTNTRRHDSDDGRRTPTHTHRTVFIACDAKRPPLPMQQTHRLGTEFCVFVRGSDIEFLVAHCLPFVSCACGGYNII